MSLLVVDGNSIANRAFFGIKVLTTREGQYTNAIYGFMNILLALLQAHQPDGVAIAFDLPGPTFRHRMYDGYKANRHGMPDELAAQMPLLQQLLRDLGYRLVTAEGWEADDILGTLAAACAERGEQCFLATGDRDNLQLVGDTTTVLLATTSRGHSETRVMDAAAVEAQYGVAPRQLIDVKSLMGDASDNIPGVKGIGEKTAMDLIQRYHSVEAIYQDLDRKNETMRQLKARFLEGISKIEHTKVHGFTDENSAPHIVSVGFAGVRSEVLLHALEDKGICVSSGSACASNHPAVSGVLKGIGASGEYLESTLRFSMSEFTTKEEIDYTLETLYNCIPMLRRFTRR